MTVIDQAIFILQVLPFLYTLAIVSCGPAFPSYNAATGVAEKATSGNYYTQNLYARDNSRIRHVSTTVQSNTASSNELATALSQPGFVHQIVEPVVSIVDPLAIVEPLVPVVDSVAVVEPVISIVDPVLPYHDTPVAEPVFPIGEPLAPLFEPLIPYNAPVLEPLVPFRIPKGEHIYPFDIPLSDIVFPYYGSPLVPVVEPRVPYQNPYYGFDPNFLFYGKPAVESVAPYYGSPYGPAF
jgi:hypothetical protein